MGSKLKNIVQYIIKKFERCLFEVFFKIWKIKNSVLSVTLWLKITTEAQRTQSKKTYQV
ncbi:hypothetical protein Aeqsu_1291 [Aequorivita sublithincola DSM 14238]|uniref:Uncharacterized protein n=1 Tax=Aequorivita sublithincola (strain DSM 14238 / LMG 21431 / ACAM 643 / 9-3) TaxID=746697 RepID=I3YUW6_AEQSU|nr:hypothetical protein Aeqsu_1291 [Aequorivita sublithincola DSM 14238]